MPKVYPFDHPLGSACLKLKRANIHIKGLRNSLLRCRSLHPEVAFSKKRKLEPPISIPGVLVEPAYIYELEIDPRIRESWALIIGDILGNLRAGLDHVAWALATEHARQQGRSLSAREAREVAFPLYESEAEFDRPGSPAQRALRRILPTAHGTIRRFQPYGRANWPELELLAILTDLTNADKHRVVTPVLRQVDVRLGGEHLVTMRLNQPDKMMFLVTDGVAARMGHDLRPQATFDVVLHTAVRGRGFFSVSELPLIHSFIRHEVIPGFASFFPGPRIT